MMQPAFSAANCGDNQPARLLTPDFAALNPGLSFDPQ
jgi:hypothetical protein